MEKFMASTHPTIPVSFLQFVATFFLAILLGYTHFGSWMKVCVIGLLSSSWSDSSGHTSPWSSCLLLHPLFNPFPRNSTMFMASVITSNDPPDTYLYPQLVLRTINIHFHVWEACQEMIWYVQINSSPFPKQPPTSYLSPTAFSLSLWSDFSPSQGFEWIASLVLLGPCCLQYASKS